MIRSAICHIIGFISFSVVAQTDMDSVLRLNLDQISQVSQGDSYITFPADIGNIEPLVFEANVNPSFKIRVREDSRLMGVLTPKVIIRMYDEKSYPVRTPSYLPQITVYFLSGKKSALDKITMFGKIAHHSNGQDGDIFNVNGDINLNSGNFSTNFTEFGVINSTFLPQLNAFRFLKSSFIIHPSGWMMKELHGRYSGYNWYNSFLAYKLPLNTKTHLKSKAHFSFRAETSWMFGKINDWRPVDFDRLNASFKFYYHPQFLEDIGLFVQIYRGMDYYNIYFQHHIRLVRFGIMTEIVRF